MTAEGGIDRLSIREKPSGLPIMYQSWQKLLFMHWQLPPVLLRPHIPEPLVLDIFEGQAWIAVTPFVVRNARPVFAPPVPCLSNFNEINVRTYVHLDGVPGVWFFSLDASSLFAVLGARFAYRLPYYTASMRMKEDGAEITYSSKRISGPVEIGAKWRKGELLGEAREESLEFFLVERYCLYAVEGSKVYRARIHHPPWKLQRAELLDCHSTMIAGQRLPTPSGDPLLHYSEVQDTAIWPLQKIR